MHVHFDDNDWSAAIARYRSSVALPEALVVDGLADTRNRLSDDAEPEPNQAGRSFDEVVRASKAELTFTQITEDVAARDATSLVRAIVEQRWTVEQVIEAFLHKAALAQQVMGCYTEIFFDRARQRAKELDSAFKQTKDPANLGRLFGVPISIKAHLGFEGTGSDRGFVFDVLDNTSMERLLDEEEKRGRVEKSIIALLRKQGAHMNDKNAHLVDMLLNEGAVIIAKTTMPQSIMHLDTRSNLYGQTLNPLNLHLSPGGSSGGEAASVASGATLAGVGTDIGGSVRQPAACVGLFGLRPTIGRLATAGTRSTMLGNEGIIGTAGPFARSLADLALLTSILVQQANRLDPHLCPPLPWRNDDVRRPAKIRIGIMSDDGFVQPITPVRRTLAHAIEKLRGTQGVELVPIDAKDFGKRAWLLARELYFMEQGQLIASLARLTGEPLLKLTEYILCTPPVKNHSTAVAWQLQYAREQFKREFWQSVFAQRELDVLLCPASALVAPRPQHIFYWGYTSLFNLTDLPGISFPVHGFYAESDKDERFEDTPQGRRKPSFGDLDEEVRAEYESHRRVFDRAPVGLQLIGHRFCEEKLIGALSLVQDAINA